MLNGIFYCCCINHVQSSSSSTTAYVSRLVSKLLVSQIQSPKRSRKHSANFSLATVTCWSRLRLRFHSYYAVLWHIMRWERPASPASMKLSPVRLSFDWRRSSFLRSFVLSTSPVIIIASLSFMSTSRNHFASVSLLPACLSSLHFVVCCAPSQVCLWCVHCTHTMFWACVHSIQTSLDRYDMNQ